MPRKKQTLPKHPENWRVSEQFSWNGRHIEPGQELTISGVRGRVKFIQHVEVLEPVNETWHKVKAEWVDVKHGILVRSFRPERIKTVHRIKKMRPAS